MLDLMAVGINRVAGKGSATPSFQVDNMINRVNGGVVMTHSKTCQSGTASCACASFSVRSKTPPRGPPKTVPRTVARLRKSTNHPAAQPPKAEFCGPGSEPGQIRRACRPNACFNWLSLLKFGFVTSGHPTTSQLLVRFGSTVGKINYWLINRPWKEVWK